MLINLSVHYPHLLTRAILAFFTAFIVSLLLGFPLIKYLRQYKIGQNVREYGPKSHLSKTGTPTMGGILILIALLLATLLWGDLHNKNLWLLIITAVAFSIIGGIDDYRKLIFKNSKGLSATVKYSCQSLLAIIISIYLYIYPAHAAQTSLLLPWAHSWELGIFFIPLSYFVIVGSSNAVNLTDGLDGLAIVPCVFVALGLSFLAYMQDNLPLHELTVFCGAFMGAGLGFLWFNAYPASIFMGDVGSLSLGAVFGLLAILLSQELALFIMGGIFVLETLSVILQVASFKITGKRVFKMAPLHHQF
jgi:phospho-N-acetylmuramoyl-pentapeptide-transferase